MRQRILLGYILGLVIGIMLGCGKVPSTCSVTDLKVNYQDNPLAVEEPVNFSWKMKDATESGQYQTAYRIPLHISWQLPSGSGHGIHWFLEAQGSRNIWLQELTRLQRQGQR